MAGDWAEYSEGMKLGWDFSFSDVDMLIFAKLSKDQNPIHSNKSFALAKGFSNQIVYGLLLSSQLSRLIGEELPDKNSILTGITMDFLNPAYPNELLHFDAELLRKSDAMHLLHFKCRISRLGRVLCKGSAEAVWRR